MLSVFIHAVAETDGLPVRHQVGGAQRDFAKEREIRVIGFAALRDKTGR